VLINLLSVDAKGTPGENAGVRYMEVYLEGMIYSVKSERPFAELAEALKFSLLISVGNVNLCS